MTHDSNYNGNAICIGGGFRVLLSEWWPGKQRKSALKVGVGVCWRMVSVVRGMGERNGR